MNLIRHKKAYWALIFMLVMTKLILVAFQPLSLDELSTISLLSENSLGRVLSWIKTHDTQMPLFYVITDPLYSLLKGSALTLRLPSLIFTHVALYCSYLHLKQEESEITAKKFLLIANLSFFLFIQSFMMRPYALTFLFSTLAYIFYSENKRTHLFITLCFLSLSHYFGLALAALLYIFFILKKSIKARYQWQNYTVLIAPIFIALYYGQDIIQDFNVIHTYRTLSIGHVAGEILQFSSGAFSLVTALYIFIQDVPKKAREMKFFWIIFLILIMCLAKGLFSTSVIEARYFIIALFPFFLIISKYSKPRTFAIICLTSLIPYFNYPYTDIDTKEISTHLRNKLEVNNNAMATSCDMNLSYYLNSFTDCYRLTKIKAQDVFYIINTRSSSECSCYRSLEKQYNRMDSTSFNNAQILHYKKK